MALNKRKFGKKAENIAKSFLMKHGFCVLKDNYQIRFGEIDLICLKDNKIHLIEVKSVSRITLYKPEDKVDRNKLNKIIGVGEFYINKFDLNKYEIEIGIICIYLIKDKKPRIKYIRNVILN